MTDELFGGVAHLELPGWFEVGRGARPTNVYLLGGDVPALIGAGHPATARTLTDALREHGTDPSQIRRVLSGSWSVDCVGAASSFPGADLFVGSLDFVAPRAWDEWADRHRAEITNLAAHAGTHSDTWNPDDLTPYLEARFPRLTNHLEFVPLRGGQFVRAGDLTLEVVAAPGPHEEHVMFFEPEHRALFCGDFVVSGLGPMRRVDDYLTTLERAIELAPEWILPAHGKPSEHTNWILKRMLRFCNNFLGATANALGEGKTVFEFVDADFGHEPQHFVEYLEAVEERRPFLDELAESRMIGVNGSGPERRYVPR